MSVRVCVAGESAREIEAGDSVGDFLHAEHLRKLKQMGHTRFKDARTPRRMHGCANTPTPWSKPAWVFVRGK